MKNTITLPTKEQFCKYIGYIRNAWDYDMECSKLARKYDIEFVEVGASTLAWLAMELLDTIFGGENAIDDIDYFCSEINFGREYTPGCITETNENGEKIDIDFSSAEKLYDYLIERITSNEE